MKIHDISKIFATCAVLALAMGTAAAAVIDVNEQQTYEGSALVNNTVNINNGGTLLLNSSWSGGGTLKLNTGGVLVLTKSGVSCNGSITTTFDGGTVRVNQNPNAFVGDNVTFMSYSGGNMKYYLTAKGLIFEVNNLADGTEVTAQIAGGIANAAGQAGTLTKTGTGVAQLTELSSYTGVTKVQEGTLRIFGILNKATTAGYTGGFNMAGGTLDNTLTGTALKINSVTGAGSRITSAGAGFTAGSLTIDNNASLTVAENTKFMMTGPILLGTNASMYFENGTTLVTSAGVYFNRTGNDTVPTRQVHFDGTEVQVNANPGAVGWDNPTLCTMGGGAMSYYLGVNGIDFNVAQGVTAQIAGPFHDEDGQAGTLTKSGTGALVMYHDDIDYTGVTTQNGGWLSLQKGKYTGGVVLNGGNLQNGTSNVINIHDSHSTSAETRLSGKFAIENATVAIDGPLYYYPDAYTGYSSSAPASDLTIGAAGSLEVSSFMRVVSGNNLVVDGGSLTISNFDNSVISAGARRNSLALKGGSTFQVNSGTVDLAYVLRLGDGDSIGKYIQKGGEVRIGTGTDTLNRSMFVGGNSAGTATISGGTLSVENGSIAVGHSGVGNLTISGGEISTQNLALYTATKDSFITISGGDFALDAFGWRKDQAGKGTINIIGSSATFGGLTSENIASFYMSAADSALNLTVDENGFSKVTATDVALAGPITLDAENVVGKAVTSATGTAGIELVQGVNSMSITGTLKSLNDRLFTLVQEGNILYAKLNFDEKTYTTDGDSITLDEAAEYGYINITDNIGYLELNVDVDNLEQFANWLDGELPEDIAVTVTEDSLIAMSNYMLAAGEAFYWDFGGYGIQFGNPALLAGMDSQQVPEPATWFMLMLGMAGLFVARRVNSRRKQEMLNA